jgi:hypothetical protein
MSEKLIDLLLAEARAYGLSLKANAYDRWIIILPPNQEICWQIKQTRKGDRWIISFAGKSQMYLSTQQALKFLRQYLYYVCLNAPSCK